MTALHHIGYYVDDLDEADRPAIRDDGPADQVLAEKVGWVAAAAGAFAQRLASRMSVEALAEAVVTLAGTTTAIVERLEEWRERHGVSYYVVPAGAADVMAPVLEQL